MMDDYDFWQYDPESEPDRMQCPVCMYPVYFDSQNIDADSFRYCSWCGARLRIRKENKP